MKNVKAEDFDPTNLDHKAFEDLYMTLCPKGNKSYLITDSVFDKLDMLKVSKSKTMSIRRQNHKMGDVHGLPLGEIIKETQTYDWTVFNTVKSLMSRDMSSKFTYILPTNECIRLVCSNGYLGLCHFNFGKLTKDEIRMNYGNLKWCFFWINIETGHLCENWEGRDVQGIEGFVFKLMCFIYLSDNEEVIVPAGQRHGTKKSGKIINSLPTPITIVTSKWNVTSIRTEGFDVSGHFRLQPYTTGTRMIFIQPFRKHGYVRRAKSLDQ
jgi:hypothetical protein